MEKLGATAWHSPDRYVQFFALITVTLQANAFQKGQQIAITCSVINHTVRHWLPSCIPNDNHKLAWQTASPWSTSPFCHSCQKLCAALLWLITPLLVEVVSHPNRLTYARLSRNKCRCPEWASKYIKTNKYEEREEEENRRRQGKHLAALKQNYLVFSVQQGRRSATSVRWSELLQPGGEWMQFPLREIVL